MFVTPKAANVKQLSAIVAGLLEKAGPLHSKVHLAQGTFVPTDASVVGDFTECDFNGYAEASLTAWEDPHLHGDGTAEVIPTTIATFAPTDALVPNTCTGYWIEDADGDYAGGEAFANPVAMIQPTDRINIVCKWQTLPSSWSATLIS